MINTKFDPSTYWAKLLPDRLVVGYDANPGIPTDDSNSFNRNESAAAIAWLVDKGCPQDEAARMVGDTPPVR